MQIQSIKIKNFKRFTDLTISEIPKTSKLVLVIGSNGSGKSSLFDAFDWLSKGAYKGLPSGWEEYYKKNNGNDSYVSVEFIDGRKIIKGNDLYDGIELSKRFLGRSSIRIVSRITNQANPTDVSSDNDSPDTYIENDRRFINDVFVYIQEINNALREPVFSGKQADTLKIFRDFIEPLNSSLLKIFGENISTTIQIAEFQDATPHTPAKLIFKKGKSKINYDLLSHGEKQVVILLINFIVRHEYYQDAIIFIDEMDCHMNTAVQYNLIQEIVKKWIPENSQLWTASHALGFIEFAKNNENATTLDFDLLNFDLKQELIPVSKENLDVYEVAIPKTTIASILKGYTLVVVENKNDQHFNAALGEDGYLFLPANNNREVFLTVKGDKEKLGLRDRDYLRMDEIQQIKAKVPNLKILSLYTFENYLYHPDNINELKFDGFNKEEYVSDIINQKKDRLIEIVAEIGTSRNHYIEFKDCIKDDGNIKPITDSLVSDEFDLFYPFFNMKKHFNKKYLSQFKFSINDLSKTQWFKKNISDVLNA